MITSILSRLRGCRGGSCKQGRVDHTEHCLDEMACTAGSDRPTVPGRIERRLFTRRRCITLPRALRALGAWLLQPSSGLESPAHINRQAWKWVREYRRDLREDFEQRVNP